MGNFYSIRNFFLFALWFLPPRLWGFFPGCFSVAFSGGGFSGYGLIYIPSCFFALEGLGLLFLSCCFSYVAIFWLFLSFDRFLAMFSWSAWFLDWGDFCYDSPYVGGRPFAGFGAFSDSFIFYYLGIAFGNLWGLFSFMAFFGDFWDLGGFLGAIFWDGSFAIWIGSISGFGGFFTMLF
jgi:hypothetical protein